MTSPKSRSSPLDLSSSTASAKRISLPLLAAIILLYLPLASSMRKTAPPDVRPLITQRRAITHQDAVIDVLTAPMLDARVQDCKVETCWAVRKDDTPAISDGTSTLASKNAAQILTAYLFKGKYTEGNYKSILAERLRYWLWAVDPRSFLFGYVVHGKVMLIEPKEFGAIPSGAELPGDISGSGAAKMGALFTVLKRSAMVLLFSPLGSLCGGLADVIVKSYSQSIVCVCWESVSVTSSLARVTGPRDCPPVLHTWEQPSVICI